MSHIKILINELGMNQTQFAERFGLSKSGLSDIVNGRIRNLPAKVQLELVQNYNINPEFLNTGQGSVFVNTYKPKEKIHTVNLEEMRDQLEEFMEHCREIYADIPTDELRQTYLRLIKKLEKHFFKWDEIEKFMDDLD
jgi:transcriptional regulator with XRE-family HTH domain